jgi:hypothetical protein
LDCASPLALFPRVSPRPTSQKTRIYTLKIAHVAIIFPKPSQKKMWVMTSPEEREELIQRLMKIEAVPQQR